MDKFEASFEPGEQFKPGAIDKREVVRAFGRAAGYYDAHAVLQREITQRLAERLALMRIAPENS